MYRDGVHYVNGTLAGTPAVLLRHPEALVYAPEHGHLQLAALEYVVLNYGLPTFYSLHAWILKYNPADMFAMWNPRRPLHPEASAMPTGP